MEKRWTPTSKRLIVVGAVIALYLLLSRIATILPPLVITLIVAYILSPIADFLASQLRLNRTLAVALIYLVLIAIIITTPALLIPPVIEQIENFVDELPKLVREIGESTPHHILRRFVTVRTGLGDYRLFSGRDGRHCRQNDERGRRRHKSPEAHGTPPSCWCNCRFHFFAYR